MSTISACLIVRDEEEHLEACLTALRGSVDEICVLDTGSEDRTLEIAERLADRVACFQWCADFSAARNASLTMASGDWILVVDADERLEARGRAVLRQAAEVEDAKAFFLPVDSVLDGGRVSSICVPRLFRNDPQIRFTRPVHESVMESLIALGVQEVNALDVHLTHVGYTGEALNRKRMRNLMLLRARGLQNPDDLYNNYKLAASLQDSDQALEQLSTFEIAHRQAEELSPSEQATYPFLPLVYAGFASALARLGRLDQARRVLGQGLAKFPDNVQLRYGNGDLALRRGDLEQADQEFSYCIDRPAEVALYPTDPAVRGAEAALGLARVQIEKGDFDAAAKAVSQAMDRDAGNMSARCLAIRLLLTGEDSEDGLRSLEELLSEQPEATRVRLLGGEVALASGDSDTAVDLWRAAAASADEGSHDARCRLALVELGRAGGLEKAREHLARIQGRDLESAACRVVLSVAVGMPLELDPSLEPEALLFKLVPPLRQLLEAPNQEALQAFAANASLYAESLPGIESILVPEDSNAG